MVRVGLPHGSDFRIFGCKKWALQRIDWQIECERPSQTGVQIMFLRTGITARSRVPAYSKDGSPEHLFTLINLCLLIERHKKLILGPN
jgi:hypothetical protein